MVGTERLKSKPLLGKKPTERVDAKGAHRMFNGFILCLGVININNK